MLSRINRNRIDRSRIRQKQKDKKESKYAFDSKNKTSILIVSHIKLSRYK